MNRLGAASSATWLISTVVPLGSERATRSFARVPPAPTTFSITMGWPRVRDIWLPIRRATVSVPPPAEYGTTSVICRVMACADARAGRHVVENRPAATSPMAMNL